jgi:aspartyl-tRNA(Asn)/glutamyl-tRNA(Gln) amidotransferase subunit B
VAHLLRETLRQLGVSDVNMEEGSLRATPTSPCGRRHTELGTKTELKNMNSFRFVERGIRAEIARQTGCSEAGRRSCRRRCTSTPSGTLTPLRSRRRRTTTATSRSPTSVPVQVTEAMIEAARAGLPELPADRAGALPERAVPQRRERPRARLPPAAGGVLRGGPGVGRRREAQWWRTGRASSPPGSATSDPAESKVEPDALARLVAMVAEKAVTHDAAGQVLDRLIAGGGDPEAIVAAEDLGALGGGDELAPVVQAAIEANPEAANQVRAARSRRWGPSSATSCARPRAERTAERFGG